MKEALKEIKQVLLSTFVREGKYPSENTLTAYAKDAYYFFNYCNQLSDKKVTEQIVMNYFNVITKTQKYASIERKYYAIKRILSARCPHIKLDGNAEFRSQLFKIKRQLTIRQKQAKAFTLQEFKEKIALMDMNKTMHIRDKAILLVGFALASRRSELISLKKEDVRFFDEDGYAIINLSKSKTNQYGEVEQKAIFKGMSEKTCPITALKKWMEFLPETLDTPLFFTLKKSQTDKGLKPLEPSSINRIIKKYLGQDYTAHSLRVSFITICKRHGAQDSEIQQQTKHKSRKMIERYTRFDHVIEHNSGRKLGL